MPWWERCIWWVLGFIVAFLIGYSWLGCTADVDARTIVDHPTVNVGCGEGGVDLCRLCWDICGDAADQKTAILCSYQCNLLCEKDGG